MKVFIMNRYISKSYTTSKNTVERQYTERGQLECQLLLVLIIQLATQYAAHVSPVVLKSTLNHDVIKLTQQFSVNHLQVNAAKTQAMTLGKSQFTYCLSVEDQIVGIEPTFKILGVTLDKDLSYRPHVDRMLKLRLCVK